jgi:glyoxylase-like metal-dependent hydrolase (beta-lactamase superfamily II)
VILIPAGNASEWTGPAGNNTYLLTGAVPALIDAGVGAAAHIAAVAAQLKGVPLASILVTHGHPDHVDGLPALLQRWPGARVFANPADGSNIPAGDCVLRAIHTPGHAPDHVCFFDEASGDLYCGDLVRLGGTIVIPGSRGGRLVDYLASLRRIRTLAPRRLLPGHGPIVDDPLALIDEYVRHRHRREEEIIAALRHGAGTPEAIALDVYGDNLSELLAVAARESVLAHLIKLRDEGAAAEEDGRWSLAGG